MRGRREWTRICDSNLVGASLLLALCTHHGTRTVYKHAETTYDCKDAVTHDRLGSVSILQIVRLLVSTLPGRISHPSAVSTWTKIPKYETGVTVRDDGNVKAKSWLE